MADGAALVRALLRPAAFPHAAASPRLIETHISWVVLAGRYVYKIKKPVDFGFLDYSTLERRRELCLAELRLNQRLCSWAYLEVVPIVAGPDGPRLGGSGRPLEYAVRMRRLPARRMLDLLIRSGQAEPWMADQVAERLAAFHATAERGPEIDRYGDPDLIRFNWQENLDQLRPYIGTALPAQNFADLEAYVGRFLGEHEALLRDRVAQGRIRDCHGDLRAESVCLTARGICIFDCIEFNDRLRFGDVASEVAFLAMDLEARGRPDLASRFVERYSELTNDQGLPRLLRFYQCYRAAVRGKVQSFRLDQPFASERERGQTLRRARHYLGLAWRYSRAGLDFGEENR